MIRTYINSAVLLLIILCIGLVGLITYYVAFEANPPVEFIDTPFKIDKTEYYPGEEIRYTVNQCRHTNKTATATYTLVNEQLISLPEKSGGFAKGCITRVRAQSIPLSVPPGTYHLHVRVTYHLTLVQREAQFITESFEILSLPSE